MNCKDGPCRHCGQKPYIVIPSFYMVVAVDNSRDYDEEYMRLWAMPVSKTYSTLKEAEEEMERLKNSDKELSRKYWHRNSYYIYHCTPQITSPTEHK